MISKKLMGILSILFYSGINCARPTNLEFYKSLSDSNSTEIVQQQENLIEEALNVETITTILDEHIKALEEFNTKNKKAQYLVNKINGYRFVFIDSMLEFGHELLRICVKKMIHEESLEPLFSTWRLFLEEYHDIDTEMFLHEIAILLFSIYRNIFTAVIENKIVPPNQIQSSSLQNQVNPTITITPNQAATTPNVIQQNYDGLAGLVHHMNGLYEKISKVPFKQLLEVLQKCFVQFKVILHEYELDSQLGWLDWLKKYWWFPPVLVGGFIANLFKNFLG